MDVSYPFKDGEKHDPYNTAIFVVMCLFIGFAARGMQKYLRWRGVKLPYRTLLFFLGMLLGGIAYYESYIVHYTRLFTLMQHREIFIIFFPSFMLRAVFKMDNHIVKKGSLQLVLMTTIGFLFMVLTAGVFMMYLVEENWTISQVFYFGVTTSLIDTCEMPKHQPSQMKHTQVFLEVEEVVTACLGYFIFETTAYFIETEAPTFSKGPTYLIRLLCPIILGTFFATLAESFLPWEHFDFTSMIMYHLCITYGIYYTVECLVGAFGSVAVFIAVFVHCCSRKHLSSELKRSVLEFWSLVYTLVWHVVTVEVGVLMVMYFIEWGDKSDVVFILVAYVVCYLVRTVMLIGLWPILKQKDFGMTWRSCVVHVWCGMRGSATLLMALAVHCHPSLQQSVAIPFKAVIYVSGLFLINTLVNGSTLQLMIRGLGFNAMSLGRVTNMNSAMRHVMNTRNKTINIMKMNRLFVDSNWLCVLRATKVVHPYEEFFRDGINNEEDTDLVPRPSSLCPQCHKHVPSELTPTERTGLLKEARLRVLKAMKMSYWRQFDRGLMTVDAIRVLLDTLEDATNTEGGIVTTATLMRAWRPWSVFIRARNRLVVVLNNNAKEGNTREKKPVGTSRCGRCCAAVTNNIAWEWLVLLLTVLFCVSVATQLIYYDWCICDTSTSSLVFFWLEALFLLLFFLEAFVNLSSFGLTAYGRNPWHFADTLSYVLALIHFLLPRQAHENSLVILVCLFRPIRIVRIFRLSSILKGSTPGIVEYFDRLMDKRLRFGYDIGKSFVTAADEVLKMLPRIVDHKEILRQMKKEMEVERLKMMKAIGVLQRKRPTVAVTIKTRESMAAVLHDMELAVQDLKNGGLLDEDEYGTMIHVIRDRYKVISKRYQTIPPCHPEELLKQVPWIVSDDELRDFLLAQALLVNLNYDEVIWKTDEAPHGIYIIISGLAKVTYVPNVYRLKQLEETGSLPNVDYPTCLRFDERQDDYIVSGNVVGEVGLLTGRDYDCTITCESSVQAFFLSMETMKEAMRMSRVPFTGLEARIWKTVAIRLSSLLLISTSNFREWSEDKIRLYLDRAFVLNMTNCRHFHVNQLIEDVLLIEGVAQDTSNRDVFKAPRYIPRTVHKLNFPSEETTTILLVILVKGIQDVDFIGSEFAAYDDEASTQRPTGFMKYNTDVFGQKVNWGTLNRRASPAGHWSFSVAQDDETHCAHTQESRNQLQFESCTLPTDTESSENPRKSLLQPEPCTILSNSSETPRKTSQRKMTVPTQKKMSRSSYLNYSAYGYKKITQTNEHSLEGYITDDVSDKEQQSDLNELVSDDEHIDDEIPPTER